jgi:hypothetical protein
MTRHQGFTHAQIFITFSSPTLEFAFSSVASASSVVSFAFAFSLLRFSPCISVSPRLRGKDFGFGCGSATPCLRGEIWFFFQFI